MTALTYTEISDQDSQEGRVRGLYPCSFGGFPSGDRTVRLE
jgi:hypothetical protein